MNTLISEKAFNNVFNDYKKFLDYDSTKFYAIYCICTGTWFVLTKINNFYDFYELTERQHTWFHYYEEKLKTPFEALNHVLLNQPNQHVYEFNNLDEFKNYLKEKAIDRGSYEEEYLQVMKYL